MGILNLQSTEELKTILAELTNEFLERESEFIHSPQIAYGLKTGKFTFPGTKRQAGSWSEQFGICLNRAAFYQQLTYLLNSFLSADKLHKFISDNNLWHEDLEPLHGNTMTMPNMIGRVGGGFLCRNFELNNCQFVITSASFEQAFRELVEYFLKDYVSCRHYVHLKGLGGDIGDLVLNEHVSIVQAGFEWAKFFSINYHLPNYHDLEVYEDDYLLEVSFNFPKEYYARNSSIKPYTLKRDEMASGNTLLY